VAVSIVRTAWSGTSGGPGLSQLAFVDNVDEGFPDAGQAQAAVNAVRQFWDTIKAHITADVTLTVSPVVDSYDVGNGALLASISAATAPNSVSGTSATAYSMASGMKVSLNTENIRNGRRVRGSLFIVPAAQTVYTTNGTVDNAVRTAVNTAGLTMIGGFFASNLDVVVWSRPLPDNHPQAPRDGAVSAVIGVETSEKVAVLRGRRD
jgi:hypothetical protein